MSKPLRRDGPASSFACRWGPPLLWMLVISLFSTDAFAGEETGWYLLPLLRWLLPGLPDVALELVHGGLRKLMHVAEFGVLAWLSHRAIAWDGSGWARGAALGAFLISAGLAGLDETHQAFTARRTASVGDMGWDCLGAALALLARRLLRG